MRTKFRFKAFRLHPSRSYPIFHTFLHALSTPGWVVLLIDRGGGRDGMRLTLEAAVLFARNEVDVHALPQYFAGIATRTCLQHGPLAGRSSRPSKAM